jgi:hypothetical protein
MLKHARESKATLLADRQGLRKIGHLDALYQILTWSSRPARESTGYMDLTRFRQRPVLPTPHAVAGVADPPWPDDPPRPGSSRSEHTGSQTASPEVARQPRRVVTPTRGPTVKPVEKGQTRMGTLRRSSNGWVAVFEGDPREAHIINPNSLPDDCAEGMRADFYITEQSKRRGIKARFEPTREGMTT